MLNNIYSNEYTFPILKLSELNTSEEGKVVMNILKNPIDTMFYNLPEIDDFCTSGGLFNGKSPEELNVDIMATDLEFNFFDKLIFSRKRKLPVDRKSIYVLSGITNPSIVVSQDLAVTNKVTVDKPPNTTFDLLLIISKQDGIRVVYNIYRTPLFRYIVHGSNIDVTNGTTTTMGIQLAKIAWLWYCKTIKQTKLDHTSKKISEAYLAEFSDKTCFCIDALPFIDDNINTAAGIDQQTAEKLINEAICKDPRCVELRKKGIDNSFPVFRSTTECMNSKGGTTIDNTRIPDIIGDIPITNTDKQNNSSDKGKNGNSIIYILLAVLGILVLIAAGLFVYLKFIKKDNDEDDAYDDYDDDFAYAAPKPNPKPLHANANADVQNEFF